MSKHECYLARAGDLIGGALDDARDFNPERAMKIGYYEMKKQAKYSFVLKAGNHQVVLASQGYSSKASAENGIEAVQQNGPIPGRYERKTSSSGQPYFNLKAANGQVIGVSEMYSSEAARDKGIDSVIANSPSETIKDLTVPAES